MQIIEAEINKNFLSKHLKNYTLKTYTRVFMQFLPEFNKQP